MFSVPTFKVGGISIPYSVLFDGANDYIHWTPSSVGNRKTWTFACWVYTGQYVSTDFTLFCAGSTASDSGELTIGFEGANKQVYVSTGATMYRRTTAYFRDSTSWMHVCVAFDSTTQSCTVYINGVSQSFSVNNTITLNQDTAVNNTVEHNIGRFIRVAGRYFNGGVADAVLVDGLALTPSYFISGTGADCKPKTISGVTWGTNGRHLNFSDANNLGNDVSSNNNDVTLVSIGASNAVLSTPTNVFATLNPLQVGDFTLSNGALSAAITSLANQKSVHGTLAFPSDTSTGYYFEITWTSFDGYGNGVAFSGVAEVSTSENDSPYRNYSGASTGSAVMWGIADDGNKYSGQTSGTLKGSNLSNGLVTKYAVKDGKIWIGDTTNGWYGSGDPVAGTNAAYTNLTGYIRPFIAHSNNTARTGTWAINTGQTAFGGTPPTGFNALCTANMPTATTAASVTPLTGSFVGNASTMRYVYLGYTPEVTTTSTINGNTITWGTHAIPLAAGFAVITSSSSYNSTGTNTYSIAVEYPTQGNSPGSMNPAKARSNLG